MINDYIFKCISQLVWKKCFWQKGELRKEIILEKTSGLGTALIILFWFML